MEDKESFYQTLYTVLVNISIILSPMMPFMTDLIFIGLTGQESVHLATWPDTKNLKVDLNLLNDMTLVRQLVEVGHRVRKEQKLKVRQPLAKVVLNVPGDFSIKGNLDSYNKLIEKELNVKKTEMKMVKNGIIDAVYDTVLSEELLREGRLRDLIRQIQEARKKLGKKPDEKIALMVPKEFSTFSSYLKQKVLAKEVKFGDNLAVE